MSKSNLLLTVSIPLILITLIRFTHIFTSTAPDFSVFWHTSKALFAGTNPYTLPNLFTGLGYPPNTLIIFLPLHLFSPSAAQAVFTLISISALFVSVYLTLKIAAPQKFSSPTFIFFSTLALISFPAKFTFGMGQSNTIAQLLLLASFFLFQKNRSALSGLLLGLAIILKTIFGFFLLYYLLHKSWRPIFVAVATIFTSMIVVLFVNQPELFQYWATKVVPHLMGFAGREIYYNQGLSGFFARLSTDIIIRRNLTLAFSLIFIATTAKQVVSNSNQVLTFSLFTITHLLIDPLAWQHHFVWLLFPFIALTTTLQTRQKLLLAFIAVAYLLASWNFKTPQNFQSLPQSLLLSHGFYSLIILYVINLHLLINPKFSFTVAKPPRSIS